MSGNDDDIASKVVEDWGEGSPPVAVLQRLLTQLKPAAVESLTPPMVETLCAGIAAENVRTAMLYFCGERISLFELVVAILDDYGAFHEVDAEQVKAHLADGAALTDPSTGEDASPDRAVVFYRGTSALRQLLKNRRG